MWDNASADNDCRDNDKDKNNTDDGYKYEFLDMDMLTNMVLGIF